MDEDQVDVVAEAAERRVESIAERSRQQAAGEPAVGFHVSDSGLDCAAVPEVALQRRGHPAVLSRMKRTAQCRGEGRARTSPHIRIKALEKPTFFCYKLAKMRPMGRGKRKG